jgi:hypothetical protein
LVLAFPNGNSESFIRLLEEDFQYQVAEAISGAGEFGDRVSYWKLHHASNGHQIEVHDSPTDRAEGAVWRLPLTCQQSIFTGFSYAVPWPELFFARQLVVIQTTQSGMDAIAELQAEINMNLVARWTEKPDGHKGWSVGNDTVHSSTLPGPARFSGYIDQESYDLFRVIVMIAMPLFATTDDSFI